MKRSLFKIEIEENDIIYVWLDTKIANAKLIRTEHKMCAVIHKGFPTSNVALDKKRDW